MKRILIAFLAILLTSNFTSITAKSSESKKNQTKPAPSAVMNNKRLDQLIKKIDPESDGEMGYWKITYDNTKAYVMTDEQADRMRILVPVISLKQLKEKDLLRLLQANYESALDARYAIARDTLWTAFIHPLSSLTDRDFLSGLAQTIVAMKTYGSSYSSGALFFQGGDNTEEYRKYHDEILQKGLEI